MHAFISSMQHSAKSYSQYNSTKKGNESIQRKNETVPLHFFTTDLIVFVENPKEYFKIVEPTEKFSKVTGYEINI